MSFEIYVFRETKSDFSTKYKVGARLAQAGNNVTFIARGKHLEAIKNNGLQLKSINGDYLVKPAQAKSDITNVKNIDLFLLLKNIIFFLIIAMPKRLDFFTQIYISNFLFSQAARTLKTSLLPNKDLSVIYSKKTS